MICRALQLDSNMVADDAGETMPAPRLACQYHGKSAASWSRRRQEDRRDHEPPSAPSRVFLRTAKRRQRRAPSVRLV
jgi:hypothetical protein